MTQEDQEKANQAVEILAETVGYAVGVYLRARMDTTQERAVEEALKAFGTQTVARLCQLEII